MFSQDSTPGSQTVFDQVVMELKHDLERTLHFAIGDDECSKFREVENDLNDDRDNFRCSLFTFKIVIQNCFLFYDIFIEREKNHERAVNESNDCEGYVAVFSRLLLLDHGLNLDNALVVRNEGAEKQKANCAHEGSDLEHDNTPVLVLSLKAWPDYISLKHQTMRDDDSQRRSYRSDEAAHRQKEQVCHTDAHDNFRQSIDSF